MDLVDHAVGVAQVDDHSAHQMTHGQLQLLHLVEHRGGVAGGVREGYGLPRAGGGAGGVEDEGGVAAVHLRAPIAGRTALPTSVILSSLVIYQCHLIVNNMFFTDSHETAFFI